MQVNNSATQIKELISHASKILLVTRENPTLDGLFAMLSLNTYLTRVGKQTRLISGDISSFELPSRELFVSQIPPRNLVISFDYQEGSIEKVSYSTEGDKFNLVITPRSATLNPESINYSYSGEIYDLIFVVDVPELPLIAQSALNIETDLSGTPLVNIDHTQINALYGVVNSVDVQKAATSEIVMEILIDLEGFDKETAALCYQGIKAATQNFSVGVTSATLETAAKALRVVEGKELEMKQSIKTEANKKEFQQTVTPESSWFSPKIFRNSSVEVKH